MCINYRGMKTLVIIKVKDPHIVSDRTRNFTRNKKETNQICFYYKFLEISFDLGKMQRGIKTLDTKKGPHSILYLTQHLTNTLIK